MNQINRLLGSMYDYQKEHNIKSQCVINCCIILDHLKGLKIPHKLVIGFVLCNMKPTDAEMIVRPTIPIYDQNEERPAVNVHCWIELSKNKIIDPSWDMYSKDHAIYCSTIKDVMKQESLKMLAKSFPDKHKQVIAHYLKFYKNTNDWYNSGRMHNKYYFDFMDYYQNKYSHLSKRFI